jgi:hypothetical protein
MNLEEEMKRMILILSLMAAMFAACAPQAGETAIPEITSAPVESGMPVPQEGGELVTPVPEMIVEPKLPVTSFESQVYMDQTTGFALDYPVGWTVHEAMIGPRGSQVQLLSSPDLVDLVELPEGATRISLTVYQWDPKNDLAAYIANWKTAWDAPGFEVVDEEQLVLELGLPAVLITLQTPDATTLLLITAIGDQYLVISGEGDMDLVREIALRLRPITTQ